MPYILLPFLALCLTASASSSNPWKNTQQVLTEICEVRLPVNGKPVTYGANEYLKDGKICRQALVCCKKP